jgi:hypothetical protein
VLRLATPHRRAARIEDLNRVSSRLVQGNMRMPEDDRIAVRKPAPKTVEASRHRTGIVHHADHTSTEREDDCLRQDTPNRTRVHVPTHRNHRRAEDALERVAFNLRQG